MIPSHLFQNKTPMGATFGEFCRYGLFHDSCLDGPLSTKYPSKLFNYETGLIFIAMTISMGLFSPIGGKMIDTFGIGNLCFWGGDDSYWGRNSEAFLKNRFLSFPYVVAALFVVGTGLGAYFTACSIAMMRSVPQGRPQCGFRGF